MQTKLLCTVLDLPTDRVGYTYLVCIALPPALLLMIMLMAEETHAYTIQQVEVPAHPTPDRYGTRVQDSST